jgi:drug/metabolite transporter (DMT)-like permease
LWNTNAFFAYVFTVKLFQLKWEPRRLIAVLLATAGVAVVVYGGSTSPKPNEPLPQAAYSNLATAIKPKATAPLVGDLLTLLASFIYGLYQVLYKKYVALPSDPELLPDGLYERIATVDDNSPENMAAPENAVYPPPFGLHPNLLTSFIGLLTLVILWIPLPLLHYFDVESFSFPTDRATFFTIAGIAASGVLFNAGFMVRNVVAY